MREQEYSRCHGAKKISTFHDCWFPGLRRTTACKFEDEDSSGRPVFLSGLSQTLASAARWVVSTPISRFVRRRQTEADRQQLVLLAHRPGTREIKALS